MKVGDIVQRKDNGMLRSGCEAYPRAVVASTSPFCLISEESDMRWSATVKRDDFKVVGLADEETFKRVATRWQRDRISGVL